MFRFLGAVITLLFAIASAIVVWPQFFRLEQTFPVAQLVAMRGLVVAGYLVLAVLMVLLLFARPLRGFAASILVVSLLAAGAHGAIMHLRGTGPGELAAKADADIRVMTWNTEGEAVSAADVAAIIVEYDIDVVSLPETAHSVGKDIAMILRESGHRMWVHHVDFHPDVDNGPQAWQTTILISPELGDYSVIASSADGTSNTAQVPSAVVMPVGGEGPTIVAVHAIAPRQDAMDSWRADLRWIADQCPGGSVILAGDFNATIDHTASLGTDGGDVGDCVDAAASLGVGQAGTWPAALPSLVGAPIDRILATADFTATGAFVLDDSGGSDHRALIVQLSPAG